MSFAIHGIGVSGGIAIGYAHLISHTSFEVAHYAISEEYVESEIARFNRAIDTVRDELESLQNNVPASAPQEFAAFLNLHLMILNDSTLSEVPRKLIAEQLCNAEWALKLQMNALLDQFEEIEDSYLRERKADVMQVVERVFKALLGQPVEMPQDPLREGESILVAHDLSPADVILFKEHSFAAFITDLGGATSHTAILARSLNIPSVLALHHAREFIREGELLIIDGTQGVVIVNPDKQVLAEFKLRQHQFALEKQKLQRIKSTPAVTLDGEAVNLFANIELPDDVVQARGAGATGIGLFRSEFLFLGRSSLPDEEEQFDSYRTVAEAMKGMHVTIRTLDIGADKSLSHAPQQLSINPALGLRAIRYCLAEPHIFNTQLRAILRASHYGKINILIPMLSSLPEINQTLQAVDIARQQLDDAGIPFDRNIKIGSMIEIPAAAIALGAFIKKLDFLSIGTNDLIQYTLAIDRADDAVAHLYDPLHPAVLQLISHVIKTANKVGVPVAVCGEMAGEVDLTRLLLGLGLREFSMHPANLLAVKQRVLKTSLAGMSALAQRIVNTDDPDKQR
ncbi:MAG: phosphoenolpyruvate--protein phosphotransferase, partial [Burkholderiales bacterium]